jgi:hypothetical protein
MVAYRKMTLLAEESIVNRIYMIRDQKVMIDRDLAELYGVETKRLKEAVRRNINRFPPDFMFEMNIKELENWRTQFASSKEDLLGLRYTPFCFSEQGVTMVSCILNSERAVSVNIQVIRVFSKMRGSLMMSKDIFLKLEQLEKRMMHQDKKISKNEGDVRVIIETLKKLVSTAKESRPVVGFRRQHEGKEDGC